MTSFTIRKVKKTYSLKVLKLTNFGPFVKDNHNFDKFGTNYTQKNNHK